MVRSVAAAIAAVALAAVVVAPVGPAEAASIPGSSASVPEPSGPDLDGDGFLTSTARAELVSDRTDVSIHDEPGDAPEIHRATASTIVALPGAPAMIGLEGVAPGTELAVRSLNGGSWSSWIEIDADPSDAPDGASLTEDQAVGPIWIGDRAQAVEVAVLHGAERDIRVTALHDVLAPEDGVRMLRASTASTPSAGAPSAAAADVAAPDYLRPRSAWATADMVWAKDAANCGSAAPTIANDVKAIVVHHTAGTNDYAVEQVPQILRGIWSYHVNTKGWCDIAYNFLVDKYGGAWEGRLGGIDKAVVGGHTFGFNTNTSGISQLGEYEAAATPSALTAATQRIADWKMGRHGVDPKGTALLVNRTGSTFRGVPDGGTVSTRAISGHRDLGQTSCPGKNTYATIESLRTAGVAAVHTAGLHQLFLRKLPSPAEFSSYRDVARRSGIREAALSMARSDAYAGLIVDDLYQRVLDRPADAEGRAYWVGEIADGTRVEDVGVQFYGSQEYVARMGSNRAYVTALYENLLHRAPEPDGLEYWTGRLDRGESLPPDVAFGFYASLESRLDRVARLYQQVLGRGPDRDGQEYWAEQLTRTDDLYLAVDLSVSPEFYARFTR